jgi:hypothetical protein
VCVVLAYSNYFESRNPEYRSQFPLLYLVISWEFAEEGAKWGDRLTKTQQYFLGMLPTGVPVDRAMARTRPTRTTTLRRTWSQASVTDGLRDPSHKRTLPQSIVDSKSRKRGDVVMASIRDDRSGFFVARVE